MNNKMLNLIVGFSALLAGISIFIMSRGFPERAALMPSLIAGIMGVASLVEIVKATRKAADGKSIFADVSWLKLGITVTAWFALLILTNWVNFFVLSSIFLLTIALLLNGKPRNTADGVKIVSFSIGISVALWVLFSLVLSVSFPVSTIVSF